MSESYHETARDLPIGGTFDVIVCGGGPAGYCAAIAAARAGATVLLIEGSGVLGGAAVQALVLPLMTFHAAVDDQVVRGLGEELIARVVAADGSPGHIPDPLGCAATITPVDPEVLRLEILRMVSEAGVRVILHAAVADALVEETLVVGVVTEDKSGRRAWRAGVVIDATGDGDVAARAGASFDYGRPADGLAQPMTMMFRMAGVDPVAVRDAIRATPDDFVLADSARDDLGGDGLLGVAGFFSTVKTAQAAGELGGFRDRVLYFELPRRGQVVVNMTRVTARSGTNAGDLTAASVEALEQAHQVARFLVDRIPGFAAASLVQVASRIGVRETRHIRGLATLTSEDVLAGRIGTDGVARGAFPIDIHSPDGAGLTMKKMAPGASYSLPYGCMLPEGLRGLLVAGRAVSATHEASASARLSPTCMALGEAAGLAAGLARREGHSPETVDVEELREALRSVGAVV